MQTHQILKKYLARKKNKSGYSMRQLAGDLDVSVSFLSRIFSGKKPIPFPLLLKIRKPLEIETEIFENIRQAPTELFEETAIPVKGKVQVKTTLETWNLSEKSTDKILRNWYFLAILEYCSLKTHDGTTEGIANALGLSQSVVEMALRELVELGLVMKKDDKYNKTNKKARWGASKSLPYFRMYHQQMLSKAKDQLQKNLTDPDFERRLITGITLTTSPEKIKSAKKRIAEFLYELANEHISEDDTEVYQLGLQLFPLTK
jgi:uncharacterized protein (TIGR02147 family)